MIELQHLADSLGSILHAQTDTTCFVDGVQIGCGTLAVTTSEITWSNASGEGFKINYHWISVHAISKDLNSFPHPCIYMMTENISCAYSKQAINAEEVNGDSNRQADDDDDDICNPVADDDEKDIIEIRFVPTDVESLTPIYQAINQGSNLNPAEDSLSEDGDDDFEPDFEEGQGDHGDAGGEDEHDLQGGHSGGDQGQFDNAEGEEAMES